MAAGQYQHGSMDISAHRATWSAFVRYAGWTCVAVVVTLALMALFLT